MSHKHFEVYFVDVMKGERKGFAASLLRGTLWVLSGIYKVGASARNLAFDQGWFRCYYPPVPLVISVGNIVAGGAGKTPVTLMIGEELHQEFSIAILSRGYRAQAEKFSAPVLLSKGQGALHPASFCGDEPYLLAQRLPKAIVVVGKDRYQSSNIAARLGAQVIIMDDGMQHRRIARDLEIVVIDVRDPYGQGYYLPRGLLRESIKSVGRADLVILNHAEDSENCAKVKRQVSQYTSAPIVATQLEVLKVSDIDGNTQDIAGKKVGMFCGIAHPDYFRKTVLELKAEVVNEYLMGDHEGIHIQKLSNFANECKAQGAQAIICTEKDRVKISNSLGLPLPILWVQSKLRIIEGQEHWNQFITKAKNALINY